MQFEYRLLRKARQRLVWRRRRHDLHRRRALATRVAWHGHRRLLQYGVLSSRGVLRALSRTNALLGKQGMELEGQEFDVSLPHRRPYPVSKVDKSNHRTWPCQ